MKYLLQVSFKKIYIAGSLQEIFIECPLHEIPIEMSKYITSPYYFSMNSCMQYLLHLYPLTI